MTMFWTVPGLQPERVEESVNTIVLSASHALKALATR
jgi:hypothetical protein